MLKINQIIGSWKQGDIHGLSWFALFGVNQRLAYQYYESGYLNRVTSGVFFRSGDEIDPYAIIRYLQQELKLKLHISGITALELQGHMHYLHFGKKQRIDVVSYHSRTFPKWVKEYSGNFEINFKKSNLLPKEDFLRDFKSDHGFDLKISCRELAILEFFQSIDLSDGLDTAQNYLEPLHTLRADMMQTILERCQSIKIKRVFLYLAEKLEMNFFKKLDLSKINLGTGKRVIVEGGKMNQKFKITVDRENKEGIF